MCGTKGSVMDKIRVLIADDEYLAIEDLINIFDWEQNGFEVVATAKNGEQALQKFNKYKPEIVITDIIMPIMTGIDLAKSIRKFNKDVRIMFLTGYAEFEYARQALDLDVEDYILKNEINTENLAVKMLEIKNRIIMEKQSHQLILQNYLAGFFNSDNIDAYQDATDIHVKKLMDGTALYLFIEEDCPLPPMLQLDGIEQNNNSVSRTRFLLSLEQDENFETISAANIFENRYILVLKAVNNFTDYNLILSLNSYALKIQRKLREEFGSTFSVFKVCRNLKLREAHEIYTGLKDRFHTKYFYGTGLVYDLEDEKLKRSLEEEVFDTGYIQKMIDERNTSDLIRYTDKIFDAIMTKKSYNSLVLLTRELLAVIDRNGRDLKSVKNGKSFKALSPEDKISWLDVQGIRDYFKNKLCEIIDINLENSQCNYSREVYRTIFYIRENFSDESLNINKIASFVSLSPTRLSFIFKKETGGTIHDYITSCRIEKAKELLKNSNYMVYEIAKMVGYGSSQYFSQVFQKYTGVNPNFYKKRCDNN